MKFWSLQKKKPSQEIKSYSSFGIPLEIKLCNILVENIMHILKNPQIFSLSHQTPTVAPPGPKGSFSSKIELICTLTKFDYFGSWLKKPTHPTLFSFFFYSGFPISIGHLILSVGIPYPILLLRLVWLKLAQSF